MMMVVVVVEDHEIHSVEDEDEAVEDVGQTDRHSWMFRHCQKTRLSRWP